MINGRIEGWRALEDFTGLKEHRIRRAIGHYGFPRPRVETVIQASTNGRTSLTNVWHAGEVLIWIHIQDSIPTMTHKQSKGDTDGKSDHSDGRRREPRGVSEPLESVR